MVIFERRVVAALALGVAGLTLGASGCGDGAPAATHNVKIDVGGSVIYAGGEQEPLAGVLVSLLDVDGNLETATTNSAGLWTIENVQPGVYVEEYSLTGYDTFTGTFAVPAGGENNVKNVFITRPDISLAEVSLSLSVSPLDLQVRDGDSVYDGLAGVTALYSTGADAAIVVTFSRRTAGGTVRITDHETDQDLDATPDATDTVWTFSEADIMTINGGGPGGGITVDNDPYTWHRLQISVDSYTPIHGDLVQMDADIFLNAVP